MSKNIIIAAVFSLLATAGIASEAEKGKPASQHASIPTECSCAPAAAAASPGVRKAEKATAVVVKQPKVESNIDLHPEDYR